MRQPPVFTEAAFARIPRATGNSSIASRASHDARLRNRSARNQVRAGSPRLSRLSRRSRARAGPRGTAGRSSTICRGSPRRRTPCCQTASAASAGARRPPPDRASTSANRCRAGRSPSSAVRNSTGTRFTCSCALLHSFSVLPSLRCALLSCHFRFSSGPRPSPILCFRPAHLGVREGIQRLPANACRSRPDGPRLFYVNNKSGISRCRSDFSMGDLRAARSAFYLVQNGLSTILLKAARSWGTSHRKAPGQTPHLPSSGHGSSLELGANVKSRRRAAPAPSVVEFISPGDKTTRASLQAMGRDVVVIVSGAAAVSLHARGIEAFWSARA